MDNEQKQAVLETMGHEFTKRGRHWVFTPSGMYKAGYIFPKLEQAIAWAWSCALQEELRNDT